MSEHHVAEQHRVLFGEGRQDLVRRLSLRVRADVAADREVLVVASQGVTTEVIRGFAPDRLRGVTVMALDRDDWPHSIDPALPPQVQAELDRRCASDLSVYSDLAGVLWEQGMVVAALQLERAWDDLCRRRGVAVTCAYPLLVHAEAEEVSEICQAHGTVDTVEVLLSRHDDGAVLLEALRRLLRANSAEQAVGILMQAVSQLGGHTAPARSAPADALPIDLSLGQSDPVLPWAPPGSEELRVLSRVLPGLVEDARVCAARAASLQRVAAQADTDPLTGLGNRRGLRRVRALVAGDSVAMVDLDHFKQVNDSHGHVGGDRVLVAFSRLLRRHLRASDLVFRLGGEEFLLVLPATTPGRAMVALENLRRQWEVERPLPVTFSAGVAPVEDGVMARAMAEADAALYEAKAAGRNRFVVSGHAP